MVVRPPLAHKKKDGTITTTWAERNKHRTGNKNYQSNFSFVHCVLMLFVAAVSAVVAAFLHSVYFTENSNECCSTHFSSALNQKQSEMFQANRKLHFAFTIQINGFHLDVKKKNTIQTSSTFLACFLLFASWHSLFFWNENVFRIDASSLFRSLMVNESKWKETPVEYKCWYHSIYSWACGLNWRFGHSRILTPTLFDKSPNDLAVLN